MLYCITLIIFFDIEEVMKYLQFSWLPVMVINSHCKVKCTVIRDMLQS